MSGSDELCCIDRATGICVCFPCSFTVPLNLTQHNSVNRVSFPEMSARGNCRNMHSLPKYTVKECHTLARHRICILALMTNLIRRQNAHPFASALSTVQSQNLNDIYCWHSPLSSSGHSFRLTDIFTTKPGRLRVPTPLS